MTKLAPPLAGLRVLVTRPVEQAAKLADLILAAGGTPVLYPTIRVEPIPGAALVDSLLRTGAVDWVVFTSPAAVRYGLGPESAAALAGKRIAAVGSETAKTLAEAGLIVDVLPDDERQEGLAEALAYLGAGTRVLFPQAAEGRTWLADELRRQGCMVEVVSVYQTMPLRHLAAPTPFDIATFASPSALRAFVTHVGADSLARAKVAVIGPTTAASAAELGVRVDVVSDRPSADALVAALIAHAAATSKGAP